MLLFITLDMKRTRKKLQKCRQQELHLIKFLCKIALNFGFL